MSSIIYRQLCLILVLSTALWLNINAQPTVSNSTVIMDGYVPPLSTATKLSASFGELRSNHFHSGLDFKTEQRIGLPVYGIADGYISRISVMPNGYGKALYIRHNDGYTSVYAHLDKFRKDIDEYIKSKQYENETFSINIDTLSANLFPIKQGELIAYSGNSGGSGGPHLHFEIRETESECPITPIYKSLKIRDNTPPRVNRIKIYAESNATKIGGSNADKKFDTKYLNGRMTINDNVPIEIAGSFSLGINSYDQTDGEQNKNGIRGYEITVDGTPVYKFDIDKFSFSESRFINVVKDYAEFKNNNSNYYKTYITDSNPLQFYTTNLKNGVFVFGDNEIHKIRIDVYDHLYNKQVVEFRVKSKSITTPDIVNKPTKGKPFQWNKSNSYEHDGFKIEAEARAFYEDMDFVVTAKSKQANTLSKVYVTDRNTPLMLPVTISISDDNIPQEIKAKTFIANIDKNGKLLYVGGKWTDNVITTKTSTLGNFTIICDTIAPVIKAINIVNNKVITSQGNITLTLTDDLSGIDKITPRLNDKWILMDWDPKFKTLRYTFDDKLLKGTNAFEIHVTDKAGNVKSLRMTLIN